MPTFEGGYVSLNTGPASVYNSTTEPTGPETVLETVKRVIGGAIGNNNTHDASLIPPRGGRPIILNARERERITGKAQNTRMPSAPTHTAEEARLLGSMPVDPMDDIELRSVQLQFSNGRGSLSGVCDIRRVVTDNGEVSVAIQGDTTKPAILTYHDLGLNYATSFAGFFNYPTMRALLENFCVYHVTAPGQEEGAPSLPEDYVYPTMDELAAQLLFVISNFGLKSIIGFGIGAGANILARFALNHSEKVGALCLINCNSTTSGWMEWGYQSFNARYLRSKGMTQGVVDYLMWHHFGRNPEERNHDLAQMYKSHFERAVNPTNLAMFINSYIHRTDLHITRTPCGTPQSSKTLKMPVINITGSLSPHADDTVTFNGRLDPTNSTWMKISDCAMVLEEQPAKLAEAFRLFLQGEGYAHLPIIINSSSITRVASTNRIKNPLISNNTANIRLYTNRSSSVNHSQILSPDLSSGMDISYQTNTVNGLNRLRDRDNFIKNNSHNGNNYNNNSNNNNQKNVHRDHQNYIGKVLNDNNNNNNNNNMVSNAQRIDGRSNDFDEELNGNDTTMNSVIDSRIKFRIIENPLNAV